MSIATLGLPTLANVRFAQVTSRLGLNLSRVGSVDQVRNPVRTSVGDSCRPAPFATAALEGSPVLRLSERAMSVFGRSSVPDVRAARRSKPAGRVVLLTFWFSACRDDLWWRFSGVRTSEESLSGVASAPRFFGR